MKKYESSCQVSRGVFSSKSSDIKFWKTKKPKHLGPVPQVCSRLFDDFLRRQEAKKQIVSIIEIKENRERQSSLQIPKINKKNLSRSHSKPDINKTIQRLHAYWEHKWLNIELRKKELHDKEEKEFNELGKYKNLAKTDPQAFRRLTSPRQIKRNIPQEEAQTKKFSMREAIESGKRLMNTKNFRSPSPTKKMVTQSLKTEDFINFISKTTSPCKNSKPVVGKNIDEIFKKCKNKAMHMKYRENNYKSNLTISTTQSISLVANLSNSNSATPGKT